MFVGLKLFFLLIYVAAFQVCHSNVDGDFLNLKNDDLEPDISCGKDGYVLIATIDGNLTSVDFNSGRKCWTVSLDKEAFFSSNLYNLEVWENGTRVWLVPSLDGILFSYDKFKLEPLPFSAEIFLSQSASLDQSTSVTGGKFKIVFGIHQHSGKVHYKCTLNGCEIFSKLSNQDALIIEVLIQTVNAVDSVSAEQKWHFRVVEIQIKDINSDLPQNSSYYMDNTQNNSALIPITTYDNLGSINTVKISLQNGYTARVNHSSSDFVWLFKSSTPIIDAWYVEGNVHLLDPFADETEFFSIDSKDGKHTALLFLGSYMNQLFIKQSRKLKSRVLFNNALTRPINYQAYCLPMHFKNKVPVLPSNESNDLVLSNLNVNDHGFYFYINFSVYDNDTHCILDFSYPKVYKKFEDYFWVKVVISLLSILIPLLLVAFTLYQKFYLKKEYANEGTSTTRSSESEQQFVSRFHKDFKLITILGRGGFGVVMEAKNRIDDCKYAVKRIHINASRRHRKLELEYVLREVKALAKLNHPGIVRYFNSWVENPPKGWQEQKDTFLKIKDVSNSTNWGDNMSPESSKSKQPSEKPIRISQRLNINPLNPFQDFLMHSDKEFSPIPSENKQFSHTFSSSSSINDKKQHSKTSNSNSKKVFTHGDNDQEPNTSGLQPIYMQQSSSSNDESHTSSSSSSDELNSSDQELSMNKNYVHEPSCSDDISISFRDEVILDDKDKLFPSTFGTQLTCVQSIVSNTDLHSSSSINSEENLHPKIIATSTSAASDQSSQINFKIIPSSIDESIEKEIDDMNISYVPIFIDPTLESSTGFTQHLIKHRDFYLNSLHLSPDDVFSHVLDINEILKRKMNFCYIEKLRPVLFSGKNTNNNQNCPHWMLMLDHIPSRYLKENLDHFQTWLTDVGVIVKRAKSHVHSLLYLNISKISEQVEELRNVSKFGVKQEIKWDVQVKFLNAKLAWPMKSIYLKKLHHYLFKNVTLNGEHQLGKSAWELMFYRCDENIYKKNLSLFRIWIISMLCHLQICLNKVHETVTSNLCYILSRVNDILADDSFQPVPSNIFFNFYKGLLNEKSDVLVNGSKFDFSMFENFTLYNTKTACSTETVVVEEGNEHSFLYIQMQLCRRDNLRGWLDSHRGVRSYAEIMNVFIQIVDAIDYVHTSGLMHRDLKPSNIYFSMEGRIKIGDFGLATYFSEQTCDDDTSTSLHVHTRHCGTELYMSPEQRSKKVYDFKTDIFPLGIILYELFVPFNTNSERLQAIYAARERNFYEDFISNHPNECMLVRKLLDVDPKERPTADEIKKHPLCQQYLDILKT